MFNKTDEARNSDAKRKAALIPSENITNLGAKVPGSVIGQKNAGSSPLNRAADLFRSLSLGRKVTIFAIAIGTLPILIIGAFAYNSAHDAIKNKISTIQENETVELADKVNLFLSERYKSVQSLSQLPLLTQPRLRSNTSKQEKQLVLESFYQNNSVYDSIAIFDTDGEVVAQTQGDELENESNLSYFQKVKENNQAHISQPQNLSSPGKYSVYVAAPVNDATTGETVYIIRARMPVTSINEVIKNYASRGHEYHIADEKGNIFLSAKTEYINKKVTEQYPKLLKPESNSDIVTKVSAHAGNSGTKLVTYVPSGKQLNIKNFRKPSWSFLLAQKTSEAFEAQNRLWLTMVFGTGVVAIAVAAIATWLARRSIKPILEASNAVARLGEGQLDTRLTIDREDELGLLSANINQMAGQLQTSLKKQEADARRAKVLAHVTLQMRQSLNATDIVQTAVQEIRPILDTSRVLIYEFNQKTWEGIVIAESVDDQFPKMIDERIDDPCFRERQLQSYLDGKVRAITDIHQEQSLENAKCYIDMLSQFAVKANLIAPIVTDNQLLGLLIAHQCDRSRNWQESEMEFFRQIATQIGYALEQSKLLEKVEKGKLSAESESQEERRQKEELQLQLLELLSEVEGAASGDLTVRADVTAGEIGTVADFFNSIVESLREIVTQVKDTANQVNTAIGSNEGAIRDLAEEALSQTTEINKTLDAVDQMTESMREVAYSAQEAANVAQTASVTANRSGEAMDLTVQNIMHLRETVGETAKKVKRLGESMQQITRVVALINQISMQTNLLAINAGIEAARAGEEGQGFAVVAEEVGELAARSASATKEIEQIVENIQRETSDLAQAMEVGTTQVVEGTRIVEDAKNSLSQILAVSMQIDSLVKSISTATTSQAETSQTISQLMKQIASVSQRTSTSSNQVSASLQQTVKISQELQKTVGTFKVS